MRLVIGELRKLWRLSIVLALLLLSALFYLLFPSYYVTVGLGRNEPARTTLMLARSWAGRFGPTIDARERAEIAQDLAEEQGRLAAFLAADERAQALGITSWDELRAADEARLEDAAAGMELPDDGFSELWSAVLEDADGYLIQEMEAYLVGWDARAADPDYTVALPSYVGDAAFARVRELGMRAEDGYLSVYIMEMLGFYMRYLAVHVLAATLVLVSPVLVRDRLHRVRPLQLTSRSGQRVLWAQLVATLVSAAGIAVVCLAAYAVPLAVLGVFDLGSSMVGSLAWDVRFPWFDMSMCLYLGIRAAMVLMLGLATAAFAFALSRVSAGYVGVLLKVIPLFVVLGPLASPMLFDATFCIREPWSGADWVIPPGGEAAALALVAAAALALACGLCAHQRSRSGLLR